MVFLSANFGFGRARSRAARTAFRRNLADAPRIFSCALPSRSSTTQTVSVEKPRTEKKRNGEEVKEKVRRRLGGCFSFVALRFASVGHVVDENTHTFGFPQISRD